MHYSGGITIDSDLLGITAEHLAIENKYNYLSKECRSIYA